MQLKSVAREAGHRSKVAVAACQEGIDPVGCCVGLRGIRIQNIVNELNGEKIDVVEWSDSPAAFIANALSPAQVSHVELNTGEGIATVNVPDKQLSLAIGKEGQNGIGAIGIDHTGKPVDHIPGHHPVALQHKEPRHDVLAAPEAARFVENEMLCHQLDGHCGSGDHSEVSVIYRPSTKESALRVGPAGCNGNARYEPQG